MAKSQTTCESTSCGTGGQCLGQLCNCGSDFAPTDNTLISCTKSGTCQDPTDYSSQSHLVPFSVYQPTFSSNFGAGKWDVNLKYQQALSVSRNVRIYSNQGILCKDYNADLTNGDASSLPWSQSVDNSAGNDQCTDVISGTLPWSGSLATCLQSGSDENVYQGNIISYTSLSGVVFNETQYGNKRDASTDFSTTTAFSFDFQSSITTNNTDFSFDLRYGTTVTLLLNTTTDTNKDASCLLDTFSNHLGYNRNLFLVQTDIDKSVGGFQFFTFLVLDNNNITSSDLANLIVQYTNSTIVSCNGVSTISVNISTAFQKILFRLVSNKFDSSSLQLTLQYDLKITSPIKASSSYVLTGNSLPPTVVTISQDNCDSVFCEQTVTLVVDLSSSSCSGITKVSILTLTPVCQSNGIQTLCDSYLAGINGQKINLPVSYSASWCPIQEKTQLSKGSFGIYVNGAPIANGDAISTTRTLNGKISTVVDSKVKGSVLSSSTITQLILTDGTTPFIVAQDAYTQSFTDQTSTFLTQFTHTIDPAITLLDFNKQLFYVATVNAVFTVPTSKRSVEKTLVFRASTETVIPVSSQSSQFKIVGATVSKPTDTPSTTSSNGTNKKSSITIPVAIGVSAGCVGLLLAVLIVVVVMRRRKSTSLISHNRMSEDIEMNSKEK